MKKPDWFTRWENNEFWHLQRDVAFNKKMLWVILGGLVVASIIERLV